MSPVSPKRSVANGSFGENQEEHTRKKKVGQGQLYGFDDDTRGVSRGRDIKAYILFSIILTSCSGAPSSECLPCPKHIVPSTVEIPGGFYAAYPPGSQIRTSAETDAVFYEARVDLVKAYVQESNINPCFCGAMVFAIALNPDGTVAGSSLIFKNADNRTDFSKFQAVIDKLKFGPASGGHGYYVFRKGLEFGRYSDLPKEPPK